MGGMGGAGSRISKEELDFLEEEARTDISDSVQPQKRCVFISFAFEDLDNVNLLRGQAKNENSELEFIDRSIKEPFGSKEAEYLRRKIREHIKQTSVTICYLSKDSAESKWVDWEIRESKKLEKGVVAMYAGDKPPSKLPPAIKELKIKLVPWSHKAISEAIEKAAR